MQSSDELLMGYTDCGSQTSRTNVMPLSQRLTPSDEARISIDMELGRLHEKMSDPFYADILPSFIQLFSQRVEALINAIAVKNVEEVKRIAHAIRGSGGMYGFPYIHQLSTDIELCSVTNLDIFFSSAAKMASHLNEIAAGFDSTSFTSNAAHI
jgi:HPt (histidine-containing phosphotransfer) domain-containing protein